MVTLIRNANIINEGLSFIGSLLIKGERIDKIFTAEQREEIENAAVTADEVINATGCYLIPGVIDDHVHFREPGLEELGTIETESRAALLGGVTSFMDMPNNKPPVCTIEALEQKFEIAAKDSYSNYSFYLGANMDNIDQIKRVDASKICGVKLFMGSSTGDMAVKEENSLENIFKYTPGVLAVHCEDDTIINNNLVIAKAKYPDLDGMHPIPAVEHPFIRSREACVEASTRAINLAHKYNTKLHILHISTASEVEMLKNEVKAGSNISGEVCTNYLWFSQSEYLRCGNLIKCNPSIKSSRDRSLLRNGVKHELFSAIGSDHAPQKLMKKREDYLDSPSGIPSVQFSLIMMMQLAEKGLFSFNNIVSLMCHKPALRFGIAERGFIREGYYADLVIISRKPFTVERDTIAYKCNWSPLEGNTFDFNIRDVFINGNWAVRGSTIIGKQYGKRLLFK